MALRRVFVLFSVLLLLAAPAQAQQAETRFFTMPNDMPLMPGLAELPSRGLAFDKPEGRIAEASAAGKVMPDSIARFYGDVLPQLGWTQAGKGVYTRQGEKLTMVTATENGLGTVRFTIAPR